MLQAVTSCIITCKASGQVAKQRRDNTGQQVVMGYDLLSEAANGGVGLLWHVEDVTGQQGSRVASRLPDLAIRKGPQPSQQPKQAALARSIGACDQNAVPRSYLHQA